MFDSKDIIFAYTRKQAIEDGVLVDLSPQAEFLGFRVGVVITDTALGTCMRLWEAKDAEDRIEPIFHILRSLRNAIRANRMAEHRIDFVIECPAGEVAVYVLAHGDDDGKPCLTVMLPHED